MSQAENKNKTSIEATSAKIECEPHKNTEKKNCIHNTGKEHKLIQAENKKKIIIAAIVGGAALLIGVAIALIVIFAKPKRVDYLSSDLSKYVYISPNDYKNFSVSASIREPDDSDLRYEITKQLYKYYKRDGDGAYKTEGVLGVADKAYIYYIGYELDGNGNKLPFDNGSNFLGGETYELQLGSNSFISGFEQGMIDAGEPIESYPAFSKITTGNVKDTQVIYIKYSVIGDDGKITYEDYCRLDLKGDVDALMGEGFKAGVVGMEIGKEPDSSKPTVTVKKDGKDLNYYSLKVLFATECENDETNPPMTVTAHFPYNYQSADMRGKTVYFDIYTEKYVDYTVPEFNDAFIKDELKLEETLADYEGATLVEKWKTFAAKSLADAYEEERDALIESAVWTHLLEHTEVKKYPKKNVEDWYNQYYTELEEVYEYYQSEFSSFAEFAREYYGLSSSADWEKYITVQAEESVAQQMMFYYIIREEGWLPSSAEFDKLYEEAVLDQLEYELEMAGCKREEYASDAAYNAAVAAIKKSMLASLGKDHFVDLVYYEYGMERLLEHVTVED